MLRPLRLTTQILSVALCALFFLFFDMLRFMPERDIVGGNTALAWYLRLNPFVDMITMVASRTVFVPALLAGTIMLVLTALFGRFFCGMFCPLGALIDVWDRMVRGKPRAKNPLRPPESLHRLKYALMVALLLLAIAGFTFPLFMDPMLLMIRFATYLLRPALVALMAVAGIRTDGVLPAAWISRGVWATAASAAFMLALILVGAVFDRRFWCQYVCPTGAFLGCVGAVAPFRRSVNAERCNECGVCRTVHCPTRAMDEKDPCAKTVVAECIVCGRCSVNAWNCTRFTFVNPFAVRSAVPPDIGRRAVAAACTGAVLTLPLLLRDERTERRTGNAALRPPGAVGEELFLTRCLGCGACISVCPNQALHPRTLGRGGLRTWYTPELVPRIGYCEPQCTRCAEACPTGALVPFSPATKATLRIGTAVVERGRCRPWLGQAPCMVCARRCPWNAISAGTFVDNTGTTWTVPVVERNKCVGCGACEHFCPVPQGPAIVVHPFGEKRRS